MVAIIQVGKKNQIVIPKTIRNHLKIKEGTKILVEAEGNRPILRGIPGHTEAPVGISKGPYGEHRVESLRQAWNEENISQILPPCWSSFYHDQRRRTPPVPIGSLVL